MSNLMIDLNLSNAKLRDRAVRIVRDITGVDETHRSRDPGENGLERSRLV